MVRLDVERDVEVLRQAAKLLEAENQRLVQKVVELQREVLALKGLDQAQLQLRLIELQEQLAARNQALFGKSSEKRPRPGGNNEGQGEPRPRHPGHGRREQPNLPIQDVPHTLANDEKVCDACGGILDEWEGQFEESEEVDVVERQFVIRRHRRQKYRCCCNACVKTAPGPLKLFDKARYSIDFAIDVAVGKYADHLPLERQVKIMEREGLIIDSQTLWDQIDALARALSPLPEAIRAHVLGSPVVDADETRWRLMNARGQDVGEAGQWYVWSVCSTEGVHYRILDNRSKQGAKLVLGDYHGIVMADGYGVYASLARDGPGYRLVSCNGHARRKFVAAEPHYPGPCAEVLDLYGQVYAVERDCAGDDPEALAQRAQLRRERSRPLMDQIYAWALAQAQKTLPESGLGKAIKYLLKLWPGLTAFLDDPRIPIDNSLVERLQRGVVVGRKNHYGSRSRRGTEVAALFYGIIETCKLVGVEPRAYLRRAAEMLLQGQGCPPLPHEIAAAAQR